MIDYLNKWLYYPWLKNSGLDSLIHPDDLSIDGIGVIFCIGQEKEYLIVKSEKYTLRVKKEGIKRILPTSKFYWAEMVFEFKKREKLGLVEHIIWHHKDELYYYKISVNGKLMPKRYKAEELMKIDYMPK